MKKRFNIWTGYAIFDTTVNCTLEMQVLQQYCSPFQPTYSLHSHPAFGVALVLPEGTVKFSVVTNEHSLVTRGQIWLQTRPKSNENHGDSALRTFLKERNHLSNQMCLVCHWLTLAHGSWQQITSAQISEPEYPKGTWDRDSCAPSTIPKIT